MLQDRIGLMILMKNNMNYLILALGNPGEKYALTRHNAGWLVLDALFPTCDMQENSYACAFVGKVEDFIIAKPLTFMNESGKTADYFVKKHNIKPEHIIVLYDDIDLPLGKMKISFDRGSGGHNGIKSLETYLGSREFIRIRIGISKIRESGELVKPNVLGNFEPEELEVIKQISTKIKYVIVTIMKDGKEYAMTEFNK